MKPDISIIIPFLNESENMEYLVSVLNGYFSNVPFQGEVVFVNDGSTDDSVSRIKSLEKKGYQVKIVSLSKNYGSHAALRAGIKNANGSLITFLYADLQDPVELISSLYAKIQEGNDIVWAHRNSTKVPLFEKLFSLFYGYMMRKFVLDNYPDKGFDIVMFNQKIANQLNENIEKNSSVFLQILGMGFRQESISYDKRQRLSGKSKWTFSKKVKLFVDSFVAFSFSPIRFVTIIGFLFFFIGAAWALYVILRKIFVNDISSGWPALISTILIGFGITNISLGIIAEYLWRTLDASRKRPVFIIDEIIEIPKDEK